MHFLCATHRRQLLQLAADKQSAIWQQWLHQGAVHYELGDWREASAWLGCAFDLACHSLRANDDSPLRLTLAALYLANTLRHLGEADKADCALALAWRLLQVQHARQGEEGLSDCAHVLLDPNSHAPFFQRYLNLPFVAPLPGRVLH